MSGASAPFARLPLRSRRALFAGLSAGLLGLSALLAWLDAPLAHPDAPRGIVSFELAGSAPAAGAVLDGWDPAARVRAGLALGLDALYLLVYPAWLALAAGALARRLGGAGRRLGVGLAWSVLLAAPLDAAENLALAAQLLHGPDPSAARLAAWCAAPKFALVAAAALYVLGAGGAVGLAGLRRRSGRAAEAAAAIEVRPLRPDEAEVFAALRREGYATDPAAFAGAPDDDPTLDPAHTAARLAAGCEGGRSIVLGAFAPRLVGVVGLAREEPARFRHKARLWGLYVRPGWRGRGLGGRLLAEAARRAREAGVAQLTLRVAAPCRAAIRLYEREGFVAFGREPRALRDATGDEDELHMLRTLDGAAP